MKKDNQIHRAIDESLDSVRFNARDTHAVLRAVRSQGASRRVRASKKPMRLDLILALSMVVLIVGPLSVFALRALRAETEDITTLANIDPITAASSGEQAASAQDAPLPGGDVIVEDESAFSPAISESEAIQAARACFEAQCDTSVFTFEEYTVSVQAVFPYGGSASSASYEVTMTSIYDNGCSFIVVVSAADGQVLSYSTPKLATMPTSLHSESAELQAWYFRHGEYLFAWPMDVQAEFSRRYEGAMLRMPQDGEKDAQYIASAGVPRFHDTLTAEAGTPGRTYALQWYSMLYSERAFADGQARYRIFCFAFDEETNEPLDMYLLATMRAADGTIEATELLPTDTLKK